MVNSPAPPGRTTLGARPRISRRSSNRCALPYVTRRPSAVSQSPVASRAFRLDSMLRPGMGSAPGIPGTNTVSDESLTTSASSESRAHARARFTSSFSVWMYDDARSSAIRSPRSALKRSASRKTSAASESASMAVLPVTTTTAPGVENATSLELAVPPPALMAVHSVSEPVGRPTSSEAPRLSITSPRPSPKIGRKATIPIESGTSTSRAPCSSNSVIRSLILALPPP